MIRLRRAGKANGVARPVRRGSKKVGGMRPMTGPCAHHQLAWIVVWARGIFAFAYPYKGAFHE